MIAGQLKLHLENRILRADRITHGDMLWCISLDSYDKFYYPAKKPTFNEVKLYNFHFAGGTLASTYDQLVLTEHKKIIPIGEALVTQRRIHTCSGLCLPWAIENASQHGNGVAIAPQGWKKRAVIIESVYLV